MKDKLLFTISIVSLILAAGCGNRHKEIKLLDKGAFSGKINGKEVSLYTLKNKNGLIMQVTNFGARVVDLWTPDSNGEFDDIVLGYDSLDKYVHNKGERFLGAVVGRYANRIARGRFRIGENEYRLAAFNNGQCLHGGIRGFDMKVWNIDSISSNMIVFSYVSPDMEEGFPGKLSVKMIYKLTDKDEFKIEYSAVTTKPTVVNLSHHSFFNLNGEGNGTVLDDILQINAGRYTPIDSVSIPMGTLDTVGGTPFDFRIPEAIGSRIKDKNIQLANGNGYDHNWVLSGNQERVPGDTLLAVRVYDPKSGRRLELYTDQPGVQFYSGNFFDGTTCGTNGKPFSKHGAMVFEAQKYPDSPNNPDFPSTLLNPGETYRQITYYKFSAVPRK
ncbi:MAG: galactose mutarotase [Bacteroidales bacterium]|nr:galactose mutarotase [Bacteroidales bacterium]